MSVNVGLRVEGASVVLELASAEARMAVRLSAEQAEQVAAGLARDSKVAKAVGDALTPKAPEVAAALAKGGKRLKARRR